MLLRGEVSVSIRIFMVLHAINITTVSIKKDHKGKPSWVAVTSAKNRGNKIGD